MRKYVVDYQYFYDGDKNAYDGTQIFLADGLCDLEQQWQLFVGALNRDNTGNQLHTYALINLLKQFNKTIYISLKVIQFCFYVITYKPPRCNSPYTFNIHLYRIMFNTFFSFFLFFLHNSTTFYNVSREHYRKSTKTKSDVTFVLFKIILRLDLIKNGYQISYIK